MATSEDGGRSSFSGGQPGQGWREFLRSGNKSNLALVCFGIWLHATDAFIVATMLPSIIEEIGGADLISWSVALYDTASVVAGASCAYFARRMGLRMPMLVAALVFGTGCLVAAGAFSFQLFLVGRMLQGIGGGGLLTLAFVAASTLFPRKYVTLVLASISTFWGGAAFLGPLIGGAFVAVLTWRWAYVFFALQASTLSIWILLKRDLVRTVAGEAPKLPILRLTFLTIAVLAVCLASTRQDILDQALLALLSFAALVGFGLVDRAAASARILPRGAFTLLDPVGAGLWTIFFLSISIAAVPSFGPYFLARLHSATEIQTGYVVASFSIGWTFSAIVASFTDQGSDRLQIAGGIVLTAMSVVALAVTIVPGPVWLVATAVLVQGAGLGFAWPFLIKRLTNSCDPDDIELVSGAIPTVQRLGSSIGAGYLGLVANSSGLGWSTSVSSVASTANATFRSEIPFVAIALASAFIFLVLSQGKSRSRG